MKEHPNFYENIKEAQMRLENTIVLYDGEPYYVLCICDHKPDGIFRMYLDKLGDPRGLTIEREEHYIPTNWMQETPDSPSRGDKMDEYLEKYPNSPIIRKMMNSPLFNRFRPFPLGMCNLQGQTFYLERTPVRHTQQGLTRNMLWPTMVTLDQTNQKKVSGSALPFTGMSMYAAIKGIYPTVEECLKNLQDPKVSNQSVGFHRHFAFVRGPLDMLFLAYKSDIVGLLPNNDLSSVRISEEFKHTKEVVEGLNLFQNIEIR